MNRTLTAINYLLAGLMTLVLVMAVNQVWGGLHPPEFEARLPEISQRSFRLGGPAVDWSAVRPAVDANLFDPSRAPYSEPVAAVEPEPVRTVDPPNVSVSGTTVSVETSLAIVRAAGEKKTRVVKPGDSVSGYQVVEIKPGAVVFEKEGQRFTVEQTAGESNGGKAKTPAAAAPAVIKMEGEGEKAAAAEPAARSEKKEKAERIPPYKTWKVPEGHEIYMTPMGPTIRKIPDKPAPKISVEDAAKMMRGGAGEAAPKPSDEKSSK